MATCLRTILLDSSKPTCLRSISSSFIKISRARPQLPIPAYTPTWPISTDQQCCACSSSTRSSKKGGKQESKRNVEIADAKTKNFDPFDFADLEAGIHKALDRLKDDLSKLRPGGRFNPETLEGLQVQLRKDHKETVRLGDLAQAVPKGGRTIVVLVGEADHIKPIQSAILSSTHSLNPIPDPHNPLELHISIPPPNAESRKKVVDTAVKAGETALHVVRQVRQTQQKKLRAMQLARKARPDDLRKAGDRMEKIVEKGNADVKKMVERSKKALEQG